ncbi:MAG: hypothetical protein ABIH21_05075 [Patescibacteria group bacterium]
MSKTPQFDQKLKEILDATQPGERVCPVTGEKWEMTDEEIGWYKKFNVPPIKVSPNTLWKQMSYYDCGYQFWWNKHAQTGKPVLSFHHPASGIRVLPDVEWHNNDFSSIHQDYKAGQTFFEQLRELELRVPFPATSNRVGPENSITLFSFGDRNSYFTFACESENTFFAAGAMGVQDSSLIFTGGKIVKSHHCLKSSRIFNCRFARQSYDCMDGAFLFDCRNCQWCFGASNKRNKKYIWMNEQLSQTEYEERLKEVDLGVRSVVEKWTKEFDDLLHKEGIWPENFNEKTEDSTGDYLNNAVRCHECYDSADAPVDNYHCAWNYGVSQNNAHMWGNVDSSDCYMCVSSPNSHETLFNYRSTRMDHCEYCMVCIDCKNCFGCIGIQKKEFCILNTQYSEVEYWQKVDEIKCAMLEQGVYGGYFPVELSSTYVPECGAVVYNGATKKDLESIGGNLFDASAQDATGEDRIDRSKIKSCNDIPDSIDDLTDEWVGVPIFDPNAGRTFSFLKPEIDHYRKMRIAPPNQHFIQRLHAVTQGGQQSAFEKRTCAHCNSELTVSVCIKYPDRRIYCKPCYLNYLEQYG